MIGPTPVLVFSKAPQPGRVKRRLIPALGAEGAARLHECMVRSTVAKASEAGVGPVQLWCTPSAQDTFFEILAREYGVELFEQRGHELGSRMNDAFERTLAFSESAILVGSDCPGFIVDDFRNASDSLLSGYPAVLTPTADGGYALIGLTRPTAALFDQVPWGSDQVLTITRARLKRSVHAWLELPVRRDIDRPEDLGLLERQWFKACLED